MAQGGGPFEAIVAEILRLSGARGIVLGIVRDDGTGIDFELAVPPDYVLRIADALEDYAEQLRRDAGS